ncbi:hypothetical protein Anas_13785 [Armadillidium nasatum]|uniref:Uncharacterized protein n=1 Tax=Armadillidium nasatum TaxID=96803 RepID=A0A5N5SR37_9CRUS|nr:hypothetical protein Anas_13785 [Armadillidium nasatum]
MCNSKYFGRERKLNEMLSRFQSEFVEETRLLNQSPNNPSSCILLCVGVHIKCAIVCDENNFCCYKCVCVCGFPGR